MLVSEFRKAAMESAEAYLRFLKEHDKGISQRSIRAVSVSKPYVYLYLHAGLPHSVDLSYLFISFYGDRFPLSRFTPKDYDEKARCILLTPSENLLQYFSTPPHEIHIVSDFRFLVSRVQNWYGLYGAKLQIPRKAPVSSPLPLEKLSGCIPSEAQYSVYRDVMTTPFSYVWGAPGTGKTTFVLSNCVLSYLLQEKHILLVAPTNNALEQMLYAILPILDRHHISFLRIRRVGVPSKQFRHQYPAVCGDATTDLQLQKHTNALTRLRALLPLYQTMEAYTVAMKMITDYRLLCEKLDAVQKHLSSVNSALSYQKKLLSKRLIEEAAHASERIILLRWRHSFTGKLSRALRFSSFEDNLKKINAVAQKLESTQVEICTLKEDIEKKEAESAHLCASISTLSAEAEKKAVSLLSFLRAPAFSGEQLQPIRAALQVSKHSILHASRVFISFSKVQEDFSARFIKQCDSSQSILQVKAEITAHEAAIAQLSSLDESILAVAMTADYFLSLDPSKLQYSHIFVDEAAYLSVIKFAPLLSLNVPVTLFGDHMQLPPVCEMSQGEGFLPNGPDVAYLWSRSAVYFDAIAARTPSDLVFPGPAPSFSSMQLFTLTATYRFGVELSTVLTKFVYPFSLSSMASSVSLFYVACRHSIDDSSTVSISERNACVALLNFLIAHQLDCAALTPYRKQLATIAASAPEAAAQERVLTVHASQGREWDIVLLSVVDGKRKFFMNSSIDVGRHVLNTAISRTRRAIVLLLDPCYWKGENQIISELMKTARPLDADNPWALLRV